MPKQQKKDPLTRAVEAKKRSIAASNRLIDGIRAAAEDRVVKIKKNIAKQQVLLEALQRGALKP